MNPNQGVNPQDTATSLSLKDQLSQTMEFSGLPKDHYASIIAKDYPDSMEVRTTSKGNSILVCKKPNSDYLLFGTKEGTVLCLYNRVGEMNAAQNPESLERIYQEASQYSKDQSKPNKLGKSVSLMHLQTSPKSVGINKWGGFTKNKQDELLKYFFGDNVKPELQTALGISQETTTSQISY